MSPPSCRFCKAPLSEVFVDLGASPLCESYLSSERLDRMEPFYPLKVLVCSECFLVQLRDYVAPEEIFTDYAYFSAYSSSWVAHAERYAEEMIRRLHLGPESHVVEVASNDGYLLQHFVRRGIPCLGIDPAANVAVEAEARGVPTLVEFFGVDLARRLAAEGRRADLVAGNNVLAQVHDLNGFVAGLREILAPGGTVTLEFPHLLQLVEQNQYDTIYHEHYSYFSFLTARAILDAHGLRVFDVQELPTHGGSLRLFACLPDDPRPVHAAVEAMVRRESEAGYADLERYRGFHRQVEAQKRDLLDFLIRARREDRQVAGYGAPGKGNTLLNYCGIRTDLLAYTVDRSPHKQGLFTPGTRIPIFPPEHLAETRPDYVLILPWNLKDEIVSQWEQVRAWGGRFVVPIPRVEVLP
jgi:SAM-dependent methyltransferase